ncbi:uncharacterized protein Bfra_007879 [Botrytis fragariae]|uniref:Uncharacterized protein n=1 Tax=Botrytis fragariae TaxID=1964551 RepID=A0A8H6EGE0_9HELO|nr:uncharacterized protein Bfra_007879 [Botrytis fragariae]KAF5871364.1 hypothetical protein Bfra_007879 [Botrytis fragariae]
MLIVSSASLYNHPIPVLSPSKPPSSETLIDIFEFGHADGAVLLSAILDTLYRDPSRLVVLKPLEEKTPPLDSNRHVSPIDSHSSPDTSSGQSPHARIFMEVIVLQLQPSVYVRAPDRTPTSSAEAPPIMPMDNGRRMNPQQHH